MKTLRIAAEMLSRTRPLAKIELDARDRVVALINDEILFREREGSIRTLARKRKISTSEARVIVNRREGR